MRYGHIEFQYNIRHIAQKTTQIIIRIIWTSQTKRHKAKGLGRMAHKCTKLGCLEAGKLRCENLNKKQKAKGTWLKA